MYLRHFQSFRQQPGTDLHVTIITSTLNYHVTRFTSISLVEIQSYTGDFDSPQFCQISLNLWARTVVSIKGKCSWSFSFLDGRNRSGLHVIWKCLECKVGRVFVNVLCTTNTGDWEVVSVSDIALLESGFLRKMFKVQYMI